MRKRRWRDGRVWLTGQQHTNPFSHRTARLVAVNLHPRAGNELAASRLQPPARVMVM